MYVDALVSSSRTEIIVISDDVLIQLTIENLKLNLLDNPLQQLVALVRSIVNHDYVQLLL